MRQIPQSDIDAKSSAYQARMAEASLILRHAMERAIKETRREATKILQRFAYQEGMTPDEARTWLSTASDGAVTREMLALAKATGRDDLVDSINRRAYAFRYSREDALLTLLQIIRTKTATMIQHDLAPTIESTVSEAYGRATFEVSKAVNIGFGFSKVPEKRVRDILKSELSFVKASGYADGIIKPLKQVLITGIIRGQSTKRMGNELRELTGIAKWKSRAIARTALTEVSRESEMRVMKDLGVKRYRYRATLDERTCPVCGKLDGTTHNLDDEQAGKNSPPMHMNCRCTVSVVVSEDVRRNCLRIARDREGKNIRVPATMTYEEWKKAYVG